MDSGYIVEKIDGILQEMKSLSEKVARIEEKLAFLTEHRELHRAGDLKIEAMKEQINRYTGAVVLGGFVITLLNAWFIKVIR